jgi:hypothetical protein
VLEELKLDSDDKLLGLLVELLLDEELLLTLLVELLDGLD